MADTDDTEWTPCGLGFWRLYRGMRCIAQRTYDLYPAEGYIPEVDATWHGTALPVLRGTQAMALDDARAWCERWAEVVAREVTRG